MKRLKSFDICCINGMCHIMSKLCTAADAELRRGTKWPINFLQQRLAKEKAKEKAAEAEKRKKEKGKA